MQCTFCASQNRSKPKERLFCAEEHIKDNPCSRHGQTTDTSMPPALRQVLQGGIYRPHERDQAYTRTQGDRLAFLIRLVLDHISRKGFLDRCGRHPPKAALCPLKFHRMHARRLANGVCGVTFETMDEFAQRTFLNDFCLERWGTSIDGSYMLPHPPLRWRACAAS